MWTAPQNFKIVKANLNAELIPGSGAVEATLTEARNTGDIFVSDYGLPASGNIPSNSDVLAYYDADTCDYIPLTGGGGGSVGGAAGDNFTWEFSDTTSDSDPGTSTFRLDSSTPSAVTEIYLDDVPTSGIDAGDLIEAFGGDNSIYIEDADGNTMIFKMTAPPTDGSGYWKIPVVHQSGSTLFTDESVCFFDKFRPINCDMLPYLF